MIGAGPSRGGKLSQVASGILRARSPIVTAIWGLVRIALTRDAKDPATSRNATRRSRFNALVAAVAAAFVMAPADATAAPEEGPTARRSQTQEDLQQALLSYAAKVQGSPIAIVVPPSSCPTVLTTSFVCLNGDVRGSNGGRLPRRVRANVVPLGAGSDPASCPLSGGIRPMCTSAIAVGASQVPVELRISWKVLASANGPELPGSVMFGQELRVEPNFFGLASFSNALDFNHVVTTFPDQVADPKFMTAQVTLRADPGRATPQPLQLTPSSVSRALLFGSARSSLIRVPMIAVPLPRLVAMFRHQDFQGEAFFMVDPRPGCLGGACSSRSQFAAVVAALAQLGPEAAILNAAGLLPAFRSLAPLLPPPITNFDTAFKGTFRFESVRRNLNDVTIDPGTFNDIEAEDEISSVIATGLRGTRVDLYNARDLRLDEGDMEVNVGSGGIVLIRNTHTDGVPSNPEESVVLRKRQSFGDSFSSADITPPLTSQFTGVGRLVRRGRAAIVPGPLRCTRGERATVRVRVTQPGGRAVAEGVDRLRCTNRRQRFSARVRARQQSHLSPGSAIACAILTTRPRGKRVSHTESWCAKRFVLRRPRR